MTGRSRVQSVDALRGFALFGVVLVNAAYFAAPLPSVANPELGPLTQTPADVVAWCLVHLFFESKSISLLCILFGAGLLLFAPGSDERRRSRGQWRRLAWLAVFGLVHGVAVWFGDILLSYAVAGSLAFLARGLGPRWLIGLGIAGVATSGGLVALVSASLSTMAPEQLAAAIARSWSPSPEILEALVARFRGDLASTAAANAQLWIETQMQLLIFLTPRSAGLMLIGMGLFKLGFLQGRMRRGTYLGAIAAGTGALAVLSISLAQAAAAGFPVLYMQTEGLLLQAMLSPVVSLGYAAALILVLQARLASRVTDALAAAGRLAFTHYVTQSVALSVLFWGGRGFGLHGEMSRIEVLGIAALLFGAQLLVSPFWLARLGSGPLEALWRRLTWGPDGSPRPDRSPTVPGPSACCPPALRTHDLSRSFGARSAVSDVSLEVPERSVYGFLGRNGSGKTTTIRMVLGLLRPSAGRIEVFGADVARDPRDAAKNIGALLDARGLYDHLTGRENLEITRRLLKLPLSAVDRVFDLVDLRAQADRRVGHYSLGMRQRLGLARALIGEPRLLILDEPMNGLDPDGIREMGRLIRELPDRAGVTVFLSSHLLSEVERTATHVGLMRAGRLVRQGSLGELLRQAEPDLLVRVDRLDVGERVLRDAGFTPVREGDGFCLAGAGTPQASARAAAVLSSVGLALWELSPKPRNLETLYLHSAGAAS